VHQYLRDTLEQLLKAKGKQSHSETDESWIRGDLKWKLHAAQKIIDDKLRATKGQLFVGNCSRQWGKSYWAVTKAIETALQKKGARIKYGTAFLTDLEEFIMPTFMAVLEGCPDSIRPVFKTKGSKWVFPSTGSEIKLVGLDKKPNGLRGNVIDMIILDECGFIQNLLELYRNVIIPATTHRPNCKIIMISTPPSTPAHPFGDFIARADGEDAYIKLDIYTNPLINQATIDRLAQELGGFRSIAFRRECLCELIIDTSIAILPEWSEVEAKTIVKAVAMPPFYKPMVTIDLALNDNIGVVFGYWDFVRAKAVIQEEILLNGVNSKQLVEACLPIEKRLWTEGLIPMRWADGQLYSLNDICSIHHYSVSMVRKDVLEAQVNSLRLMLQAGQVEIQENCKQTIRQCASGIWNKQKTQFARQGSNHQDLLAALIYFVRHLNKENPFPRDHQYNRDTMHFRPDKVPAHLAGLKKTFGGNRAV
jgi:hypothetical protein